MVFTRTPAAAAALEPTDHPKPEAYAVQDGRAEGWQRPPALSSSTGRCFLAGQTTRPACGRRPAGLAVRGQPQRPGVPSQPPAQRACGKPCWNTALSGRRRMPALLRSPCTPAALIRSGAVCLRKHPLWGDGKYGDRVKVPLPVCRALRSAVRTPGHRRIMNFTAATLDTAPWNLFAGMMPRLGENSGTIQN